MADESFHEIQLNGKQLVFLFMAATVVAVVIFLCGVMVGRGVPTRAGLGDDPQHADLGSAAPGDVPVAPPVVTAGSTPVAAQETLTYPTLLENPDPPIETFAPVAAAEVPAPVVSMAPERAAVPRVPAAATPAVAPGPVSAGGPTAVREREVAAPGASQAGTGFVVQVAAVKERAEADAIARRLVSRGYPAFVTTPGTAAAPFFRVRVGTYADRSEADAVATRLEREEQFKPWITR